MHDVPHHIYRNNFMIKYSANFANPWYNPPSCHNIQITVPEDPKIVNIVRITGRSVSLISMYKLVEPEQNLVLFVIKTLCTKTSTSTLQGAKEEEKKGQKYLRIRWDREAKEEMREHMVKGKDKTV